MYKMLLYGCICWVLGMAISSYVFRNTGHKCKYRFCPYKGIHYGNYKRAVVLYTGDYGNDAYKIDILHLEHPTLDNDQLDSILAR